MGNRYFWLFFGILMLLFVPYLFGEHNFIGPWPDILDDKVVQFKSMVINHEYFFAENSTFVPQFLNFPRVSLGSEMYLFIPLTYFLGSYNAVVFTLFVSHALAFFGMYLLLDRKVFHGTYKFISAVIAFSFALLDFWIYGGISISAIPLLLYFFLEILAGRNKWGYWILFAVYPFYSNFIVFGFFVYLFLFIIFLIYSFKNKKINYKILGFFAFSAILELIVDYRYFLDLLHPVFVSQRVFYDPGVGLRASVITAGKMFLLGHLHSFSHQLIIVIFSIFYVIYSFFHKNLKYRKLILGLLALAAFIAFFRGFWNWSPLVDFMKTHLVFITAFRLERFFVVFPVLWYLILGLVCFSLLNSQLKFKKIIISVFLTANLLFVLSKSYTVLNFENFTGIKKQGLLMFDDYFAEDAFAQIKKDIPEDASQYRVASFALHPVVAMYNGFQTVDGYIIYYPVEYKEKFAKVIAHELSINPAIANHFKNWGTKLYLFQTDEKLGAKEDQALTRIFITKDRKINEPIELKADTDELKNLGARYIISAVPLRETPKLTFIKDYESNIYHLYLYRLN